MTTETLRVSGSAFQMRVLGLWQRVLRLGRRTPRRLRLCESLPLGERRFVAVVEFDQARFLVGGTPSSLVLLSRLTDAGDSQRDDRAWIPQSFEDSTSEPASASRKRRGETC